MTTPSVPRCGRLDDHAPHKWDNPVVNGWQVEFVPMSCQGHVVTEGAQPCVACQRPVAICRCAEQLADERHKEWYS